MKVIRLGCLVSVLAFGCDKKADECRRIVNIVNDSNGKVARPTAGVDPGIAEQNSELALLAEKMASSLASAAITTPELKKL